MFRRQQPIPTMHMSFQSSVIAVMRRIQWALFLIALTCLGFAVSFLQESRSLDEQSDYYEHALSRQHRASQLLAENMAHAKLTLTDEQIDAARKEIAFSNQLREKRDFSWTQMLHNLEEGMPPHVSISSVRLNFQDSTIRLQGTVKTMQDLDALVTKLNEARTFSRVGLSQHSVHTNVGPALRATEAVAAEQSNQRSAEVIDFVLTVTYHQPM